MHWEQQMGLKSWPRMTMIEEMPKWMHQEQQMGLKVLAQDDIYQRRCLRWCTEDMRMGLKSWLRLTTIDENIWHDALRTINGSAVLAQDDNDLRRRSTRCTQNKWVWSPGSGWHWSEEMLEKIHQGQQMGLSPGWCLSKKTLEMMHWGPANGSEVLAQADVDQRRCLSGCTKDGKWV